MIPISFKMVLLVCNVSRCSTTKVHHSNRPT